MLFTVCICFVDFESDSGDSLSIDRQHTTQELTSLLAAIVFQGALPWLARSFRRIRRTVCHRWGNETKAMMVRFTKGGRGPKHNNLNVFICH